MNGATDSQDEVFGFLADPANHGGKTVERIDTHAASVFLAGDIWPLFLQDIAAMLAIGAAFFLGAARTTRKRIA